MAEQLEGMQQAAWHSKPILWLLGWLCWQAPAVFPPSPRCGRAECATAPPGLCESFPTSRLVVVLHGFVAPVSYG